MILVLLAVLMAADDGGVPDDSEPALLGVDESGGCIQVAHDLLGTLDGVVRGDFETMVRLVDGDAAKRFDDVAEKPYKKAELVKELSRDRELGTKIQLAKKHLAAANYCLDLDTNNVGRVAFLSGSFRLGMGNSLMSDKLAAATVIGSPYSNGTAITVGTWKRVECWEEEGFVKPCGPVFRDMPKDVKAVVEDANVQVRWKWRGLPKLAAGFVLEPWRDHFVKQKSELLAVESPTLEFFDGEKVLWTAK